MTFRRIAASALLFLAALPLFASTKKIIHKPAPSEEPVCDVVPLPASSVQKPPLSPSKQQQLDDALLDAVDDSKIEAVKKLLAEGADPNARDEHCVTPLMISAEYFDTAIAEALTDAGADVNAHDMVGWTALLKIGRASCRERV